MPSIYGTRSSGCKGTIQTGSLLPDTTVINERLISTGSEWVVDTGKSSLLGRDISSNKVKNILIGNDINISTSTGERAIILNTGSAVVSADDDEIILGTNTVDLSIKPTSSAVPQVLGTLNDSNYSPLKYEDVFNLVYNTNTHGSYLYYNSASSSWSIGDDQVTIGTDAGLSSTLIRQNTLVGYSLGSPSATFDLSTIIGQTNCQGTISGNTHVVIGNNNCNTNLRVNTVCIGSLINDCQGNNVCIGYRLGFNSSNSSSYSIGQGCVVLGINVYVPVGAGSVVINGSNTAFNDTVPNGTINIKAFSSQIKLEGVNITATPQASGNYALQSEDGVNYAPKPLQNIYKNQRVFWTHYTKTGDPVLTANIGITSAFNLFTAPPRRLEYSPTGSSPAIPPQWVLTATNRMRWEGANNTPVSVEVNMEVERVTNGLCLAQLVPVYNGSETDIKILGNACDARISRNSTTSLHLSFILDLDTNDEIYFILKKTNGTATSNVRIRYSDVKIYSLRTDKLSEGITTDV